MNLDAISRRFNPDWAATNRNAIRGRGVLESNYLTDTARSREDYGMLAEALGTNFQRGIDRTTNQMSFQGISNSGIHRGVEDDLNYDFLQGINRGGVDLRRALEDAERNRAMGLADIEAGLQDSAIDSQRAGVDSLLQAVLNRVQARGF